MILDLFMVSKEVEQSLAHRETAKCLAWCHDNRSKLRKLRSTMEFNLRIQEFIELVRQDKRLDAVKLVLEIRYFVLIILTIHFCVNYVVPIISFFYFIIYIKNTDINSCKPKLVLE